MRRAHGARPSNLSLQKEKVTYPVGWEMRNTTYLRGWDARSPTTPDQCGISILDGPGQAAGLAAATLCASRSIASQ